MFDITEAQINNTADIIGHSSNRGILAGEISRRTYIRIPELYTLGVVISTYNPHVPTVRWEVKTGDSLKAHGPASLVSTAANNKSDLASGGRQRPTPKVVFWQPCPIPMHMPHPSTHKDNDGNN